MPATSHRSVGAFIAALMLGGCQWLIFEPDYKHHARPADFSFPIVELKVPVRVVPGQEERLDAWWIPASQPSRKTLLYLHGRDSNVSDCVADVAPLRDLNLSMLLVDYRGFGSSDGILLPSESTVYEDAEAAWTYLVKEKGVLPSDLYIYGHSLGGAIAIELARRHPEAAGLIIESSFTSIYDMTQLDSRYRHLPVKLFLRERFESLSKVPELRLPALFVHGTADDTVPFWMGKQLFDAAPQPKRFVEIDGGGHDHDDSGARVIRTALGRFIEYPLDEPAVFPF